MVFSVDESLDKIITELSEVYAAGNLNVLIGAGASVGAGFPAWDKLNSELLRGYLEGLPNIGWNASLDEHVEELLRSLGKDAAADFVFVGAGDRFWELLSRVLYKASTSTGDVERKVSDLPIRAIHRQLAALALRGGAAVYD